MNIFSALWTKLRLLLFFLAGFIIIAVIGYLLSYGWFFYQAQGGSGFGMLKSQITANQEALEVKKLLQEKGFEIDQKDFHQLNAPFQSTRYTSDVLSGYEPVKEITPAAQESYLFYAKDGTPFYMETKDSEPMALIHE